MIARARVKVKKPQPSPATGFILVLPLVAAAKIPAVSRVFPTPGPISRLNVNISRGFWQARSNWYSDYTVYKHLSFGFVDTVTANLKYGRLLFCRDGFPLSRCQVVTLTHGEITTSERCLRVLCRRHHTQRTSQWGIDSEVQI